MNKINNTYFIKEEKSMVGGWGVNAFMVLKFYFGYGHNNCNKLDVI